MLTYEKPTLEQYETFLQLMREKTGGYLEPTLRAMEMTWEAFDVMFRSVGEVRSIRRDGVNVGFVWIERRDRTLHVHGLALDPPFRGQGIGTRVFRDLEREFRGEADIIELGVHESNPRAWALYERLGFRVGETLPDVQFAVLRKPLGADAT